MKKTIVITGSTDGIGKLTAAKLAEQGHEIYLHGRNADKLSSVIAEIKGATGNEKINGFLADFSDLNAVKQVAQQLIKELSHIDVLINNAGVYNSAAIQNNKGLDMRFAVNYFAPYVLTNELMPLLKKGKNARVLNLSSAAQTPINFAVLLGKELGLESDTYAQSKLALTMWSFYLAQKESELVVIPVNPGSLLNTKMVKEAYGKSWSSVDKGADILCDLSSSEAYNDASGKYFDNDRGAFGRAHIDAYDSSKIEKLINTTSDFLS